MWGDKMKKKDMMLAFLLVVVWGVNFIAIKLGVGGVPSMLLAALRYLFTFMPAIFFIKKPNTEWKYIIFYGMFVGVGQFGCLFYAMEIGMPVGIASIVTQLQAFMSPVLAMIFLNERIKTKQIIGFLVAACGLFIIGIANSKGGISSIPIQAIILNIIAPFFWAASNIVARVASDKAQLKGEKLDMFSLVVWSALVPPIPLLGLALVFDTPSTLINVIINLKSISLFAILYLAIASTLIGYGIWSKLIGNYPMGKIAPIPLLVPVVALFSARIVFNEHLSPLQWMGVSVILAGLIISNLNLDMIWRRFRIKKAENGSE